LTSGESETRRATIAGTRQLVEGACEVNLYTYILGNARRWKHSNDAAFRRLITHKFLKFVGALDTITQASTRPSCP
ncbi:hypothetical protein SB758_34305, partial [Burkholderia sp. SIMBA_013]